MTLPQSLARLDHDRLGRYQQYLDFYQGNQWQPNSMGRSRGRRLTFNYAKVFIDKLTQYMMSGIKFVVEPTDSSPEAREKAKRAEAVLYQVYEQNNLELLDFDTEIDTAILGDGCYKVTWDVGEHRCRISAPDVQGIFAWWLGDDVARIWRVASRYSLSAEEVKLLYGIKLQGNRVWITEVWTEPKFELWLGDYLMEKKANPYGLIPFILFPNIREPKKFWGISDIPQIIEPQRELNRALSQLSTILELSGNPIAVLENIERAEDIAVSPGAVWQLPEDARAYLLDLLQGGGVSLHIDYINTLFRTLHDLSEIPRTAFGENQKGLSGIALEMELYPLLQKIRAKRLVRASAYKKRNQLILTILERITGENYLPVNQRIVWGPTIPQDLSREVRDEISLVEAGIHSRRTAMSNLGVPDVEVEYERIKEEAREKVDKGGRYD